MIDLMDKKTNNNINSKIGHSRKKSVTKDIKDKKQIKLPQLSNLKKQAKQNTQQKKLSIKDLSVRTIVIICFVLFFLLFMYLLINRRYDNSSLIWRYYYSTNSFGAKSNIKYDLINNNTIRWTNDGVTEIGDDGNIRWTMSYNIKSPIYVKKGKYFVISGIGENKIYLFNENGIVAESNTDFPVLKIDLSENGIVYALLDGGESSFIEVYNAYGERLDITIKSLLRENGMPVDIAVSNDGTELMVSFLYLDNTTANTRVVFYNFDEVGKNKDANRIVGGFDSEYKGKYVSKVKFFDNKKSICFYDGGITFFSTKILTSPTIVSNIKFDDIIRSIAYNDDYVALVLENEKNKQLSFVVYSNDGKELSNKKINFMYDNFMLSNDYVVFTHNTHVYIYDINGNEKLNREYNDDLYYVGKKKKFIVNELVLGASDYCDCVSVY